MGMLDGLNPAFSDKLQGLMSQAGTDGINLRPLSGYRNEDDQRRAIDQVAQRNGIPLTPDLYSRGIPGMAAPVGKSLHQSGSALDWDVTDPKVKSWLYQNAPQYGFRFPLPNSDSGHMQMDGNSAANPASQVQVPSPPNGSQPMPQQTPQGLPGLLGALQSGMQSPLFQQGLGTYNAGASGQNWAGGLLAGQKSYQDHTLGNMTMRQHQLALDAAQREAQQQHQADAYMRKLKPTDHDFNGLPSGAVGLALGTGDKTMLAGLYGKHMDLDQQMKQAVALGDIQTAQKIKLLQQESELERQKFQNIINLYRPQNGAPGSAPLSPPPGVKVWSPNTGWGGQ